METIDIGIPCAPNTEKYIKFLIESIIKTKSNHYIINFLIGINSDNVDINYLQNLKNIYEDIKIIKNNCNVYKSGSSSNHGESINFIINNFSGKFGMIIDADVAFLSKNWDLTLTSFINNEVIIIGSEYGLDDFKYMGNPNIITCLFDTKIIKSLDINFLPKFRNNIKKFKVDNNTQDIYKRKVGEQIILDTGFEIPLKLYQSKYNGKAINLLSHRIKSTKSKIKFLKEDVRGEEFQIHGTPIFTHLGRATTRDFDTNEECKKWRNCVNKWLKQI